MATIITRYWSILLPTDIIILIISWKSVAVIPETVEELYISVNVSTIVLM